MYKIKKLPGCIVQHREYRQYFITTINGVYPLKIMNHYVVHLQHIILYIDYTSILKKEKYDYYYSDPQGG